MPEADAAERDSAKEPRPEAMAEKAPARMIRARAEEFSAPPAMTLPYMEFSHALMRAHLDVRAMATANRKLTDALREVVRRQQDLAWQLAETTLSTVGLSTATPGKPEKSPGEVFDQAAAAVRELGEAMIEAQLGALRTLQSEAASHGEQLKPNGRAGGKAP